ncbi:hypothetical protein Ancab_023092 [Ancistrocladus abbreviatus]
MDIRFMGFNTPLFHAVHHVLDATANDDSSDNRSSSNAPSRNYVRDARAMASTPADVKEYPNSYQFIVDMPGLKSREIKVQVEDDNVLMISGERKRDEEKEGVKYVRMERRVGNFLRKFVLPENASTEAITAVCQDGVLTVTVEKLPPPESKKPKTIQCFGASPGQPRNFRGNQGDVIPSQPPVSSSVEVSMDTQRPPHAPVLVVQQSRSPNSVARSVTSGNRQGGNNFFENCFDGCPCARHALHSDLECSSRKLCADREDHAVVDRSEGAVLVVPTAGSAECGVGAATFHAVHAHVSTSVEVSRDTQRHPHAPVLVVQQSRSTTLEARPVTSGNRQGGDNFFENCHDVRTCAPHAPLSDQESRRWKMCADREDHAVGDRSVGAEYVVPTAGSAECGVGAETLFQNLQQASVAAVQTSHNPLSLENFGGRVERVLVLEREGGSKWLTAHEHAATPGSLSEAGHGKGTEGNLTELAVLVRDVTPGQFLSRTNKAMKKPSLSSTGSMRTKCSAACSDTSQYVIITSTVDVQSLWLIYFSELQEYNHTIQF